MLAKLKEGKQTQCIALCQRSLNFTVLNSLPESRSKDNEIEETAKLTLSFLFSILLTCKSLCQCCHAIRYQN